jgi:hypothetical protein
LTLIDVPTEQTTAATDLIIAVLAVVAAIYLRKQGPTAFRGRLWRGVFWLLACAGLLGAIGHGLTLDEHVYNGVWLFAYLTLALLVAAFLVATLRDLVGDSMARRAFPLFPVIALAFFGYAMLDPGNFMPFILYESAAMALSLAGFAWITIRGDLPGAAWITAAIAVNIVAAAIQAQGSLGFTLIWTFDHNGVFHLVQMLGIGLLVRGLRTRPAR